MGGAVQRNRAKRLLREAFRAIRPCLQGAHDMVLVARPEAAETTMPQVRDELAALLQRARILECGHKASG